MKAEVYSDVEKSEDGWWYLGRRYALGAILPRFAKQRGDVLDVGAGYGAMFSFLSQFGKVTAYEVYPECVEACQRRGYTAVLHSEVELRECTSTFDLIGAFDVIEHIENDNDFLKTLHCLLKQGGVLAATVPAHPFLFGPYDTAAHHFRRYSKRSLQSLLEAAGFEILYVGYWNSLLFFPAALARMAGRGGTGSLLPHPIVDRIFASIVYIESWALRYIPLPIGMSLIVVAKQKATAYSAKTK